MAASNAVERPPLTFTYRNYRGEVAVRRVHVESSAWKYGATPFHPEPQHILTAFDLDKGALRDFAVNDILRFGAEPVVRLTDAVQAVRDQPFYPDTHTGARQQWMKDEIVEKLLAIGGDVEAAMGEESRNIIDAAADALGTPQAAAVGMVVQNPIEELRLAALDAFPDLRCRVFFAAFPAEGPFGETFFPDDGGMPTVQVAVGIPMQDVIEVMAHELAHVAAGLAADHGAEWEEAFAKIHGAYLARMGGADA